MNLDWRKVVLGAIAGLAFLPSPVWGGCGGTWEVPKDHFDGVNEFGRVSYWTKIGEIDIGEDKPFPIVIGFQSDRGSVSPYLGYGWVMPLLESSIVQTGENSFEIMKPTGYTSGFDRDAKKPAEVWGVKGWKGQVGSDTIKVWAPCGWSLTYQKGRLIEIGTPKNRRVLIKRDLNGLAENVTLDGQMLVDLEKGFGGQTKSITIGKNKYLVNLVEKPRVQSPGGQNVIVGKDLSLGEISSSSGEGARFEYAVTPELQPNLVVSDRQNSKREISWNARTSLIERDGDWKYKIEPSSIASQNASITRTDSQGKKEHWHFNMAKSEEVSSWADGREIRKRWFSSGKLAGQLRETQELKAGQKTAKTLKVAYDENGRIMRTVNEAGDVRTYEFEPGDSERYSVSVQKPDGKIYKYNMDNGKIVSRILPGGMRFDYKYDEAGKLLSSIVSYATKPIK